MNRPDRATLVLAIVLAVFLWVYVRIAQDAPEVHQVLRNVPVEIEGRVPSGLRAQIDPADLTTDVEIRGRADLVENVLRDDALRALVNADDLQGPQTQTVRVRLDLPRGVRVVGNAPKVTVTTYPLERKTFPVTVAFISQPPPGTTVGEYTIEPSMVTVEGSTDALKQIKYVTVSVDPNDTRMAESAVSARPVGENGEIIRDVTVLDPPVNVRAASLTGPQTTRQVAVRQPELLHVPRGVIITARVRPDVVTLSGRASLLNQQPAYLATDPIDVRGISRDTTRTARLRVPNGLTVSDEDVRVDLQVHPVQ